MEIIRIAAQRSTEKLHVAVYCRVSTKKEEQEDSLEEQRKAYTELIRLRSDWMLAGVYSDSISGLRAEKRPDFMRMIKDALDGKIDRILCKSVSRFSRNVSECKKYTDILKNKNIPVEFEKEHICTDDPTCSFIFSLMAAIAENESRSISENVKWGFRERVKRGEYNLGNNRILGYDSVKGKLVPNEDAEVVRTIFALYLAGKSIEGIRRQLFDIGVQTRNGRPISHNNILYILNNETYKGDKLLQKTHPKDLITKRPDPNTPFESNYLSDDHEAIVDKKTWDAVQQKIKENKELEEAVGHRGGQPHFLYGKVFCGSCGNPMIRRTVNGVGGGKCKTWVCRGRYLGKNGNGCRMRNVKEDALMSEIKGVMGYDEDFPVERFLKEVERVEVCKDGLKVVRKQDCKDL